MLSSEELTFTSLPDELKVLIYSYLNASSLCNAIKVNREWNILADEESFWKTLCLRENKNLNSRDQDIGGVITDWKGYFIKRTIKGKKAKYKTSFGLLSKLLMIFCLLIALAGSFYVAKQHYILATFVPTTATIRSSEIMVYDDDGLLGEDDDGPNYLPHVVYEYQCYDNDEWSTSDAEENTLDEKKKRRKYNFLFLFTISFKSSYKFFW